MKAFWIAALFAWILCCSQTRDAMLPVLAAILLMLTMSAIEEKWKKG